MGKLLDFDKAKESKDRDKKKLDLFDGTITNYFITQQRLVKQRQKDNEKILRHMTKRKK